MKKTELKKIIREEIKKVIRELSEFEAIYRGKKIIIKGDDLWDAKQKAIKQFNIPKSKQGLLAIQSLKSKANQDFRFEAVDNSIYVKPKNLKQIGWMIVSKRKNDGRPIYKLYDNDDKKWNATYRMGTSKYTESSPLFYTIPIKVESSNRFRILQDDNGKWGRPYAYDKVEIKGTDY